MDTYSTMEIEEIEGCIVLIRGVRVIMDSDLARLFGVSTKRLNEQVRRNIDRFPQDFMFQLTQDEKTKVVANCDHLQQLRFSTALPLAFTEHGTIMAASILNSTPAIETSILVVRAFVRMRHMIAMVSDLAERLNEMESRYDRQTSIGPDVRFSAWEKSRLPGPRDDSAIICFSSAISCLNKSISVCSFF